jgi:hypothetical protein
MPAKGNRVSTHRGGFLQFALLANALQQAVCGQVKHQMSAESRPNLGQLVGKLDGPVLK